MGLRDRPQRPGRIHVEALESSIRVCVKARARSAMGLDSTVVEGAKIVIGTVKEVYNELEKMEGPGAQLDWNKSFSAPDLSGPVKGLDRFLIKHPHEYISVDDLKYFRRKKPSGLHTKSQICLFNSDEPELPFAQLRSEYRKCFQGHDCRGRRAPLLRRATSLRLEGLMNHISEHHDKYHWYTPQDWELSRTYPVRYPESIRLGPDDNMDGEYRSSYITHPMVDRTMKILPREAFTIKPEPVQHRLEPKAEANSAMGKLAEDKFKRDVAARENAKCHLQQRAADTAYNPTPSEYMRQFVQFPIREKAHSIPQISHIKMGGNFDGVPEYREKFCMYPNYSKSAPIKKIDNLRISGSEEPQSAGSGMDGVAEQPGMAEYQEKYRDPPKQLPREKSLKTDDHLHPQGKFSTDLPEYYESFRDPQVKELPERGKCREPYLRLNGKIEFNPEYRNTYLDFPRSRPVVTKPSSSLRLPISSQVSHEAAASSCSLTSSPPAPPQSGSALITDAALTSTPEYRRAQYNYQIRERTPPSSVRKGTDSTTPPPSHSTNRRRSMRNRQASMLDHSVVAGQSSNPEYFSAESGKKPVRFGRRASVLHNASHCRGKSSIIEGNPKYASTDRRPQRLDNERGSFVVLNDPCKKTNWAKKTWFDA